ELLVDLLVGHRDSQALELEPLDGRRLDLGQHLELDLELGVLALLVALVEVDLRLQRRAQLLLAHQRVDRFAQARVERVGVQCLAVHLADQVRGHLAGAEAGHAHLRRDLLHLGVDARLDLLRGNLERVGALEPFIGGFNDLHFRTFHKLSSEPAPRGNWCGRRDSNPHILRYWNLNPARLPVPPRPRPDESIAGTRLRNREPPLEARARKGKTHGCPMRSAEQAQQRLVSIVTDKEPIMTQNSDQGGRIPDGDAPGSQPAHYIQGGGDVVEPGKQPDEIVPGKGDDYRPDRTPDEVAPGQGDFDRPDRSPVESPPQPDSAPPETPASPD